MRSLTTSRINADEFIANYGDDPHLELVDGELIEMEPTGPHEQVTALVNRKLNAEIERLDLPYFIPSRCLLRPLGGQTAFRPDAIVLDERELRNEPLWQREPVITLGTTIALIVEVVSTNWQNDYARKLEDYAALGISEYWIVDYLGLGGKAYIGHPKQPTVSICLPSNGDYRCTLLRRGDTIRSQRFPELRLDCDRLFALAPPGST